MIISASRLLLLASCLILNIYCSKSSGSDPLPPPPVDPPDASKPQALAEVDAMVSALMTKFDAPGMSLAVTKNGKLVYVKGYGKADKELQTIVTDSSRFRIASISKSITSVAIMKLKEAGKLTLDDKVFGPGAILGTTYGTVAYTEGIKAITVRHLLHHTSGGWPNDGSDPMFMFKEKSAGEMITYTLDNIPLANFPGTNQAYSNFGYNILGRVIEKLSGKTYEEYVKSTLLAPLGITKMEIGGSTLAQRKPNEVRYYPPAGGDAAYTMNIPRIDAAGGWIASSRDYVRLLVSIDGFSTVPDILSFATITEMTTRNGMGGNYACGIVVNNANNWFHNGGLPGTNTFMVRTASGMIAASFYNGKNTKDNFGVEMEDMLWNIVNSTTTKWPEKDLF